MARFDDKKLQTDNLVDKLVSINRVSKTVKGMDKCLVGQFADKIHKVRKADPYKGKGIFYKGERIRRKEGKKK